MTTAHQITSFLFNLHYNIALPPAVEVMNPFNDKETRTVCGLFYNKYYNDDKPRHCIIGINPGRFGGGITGVPFTDPIRLKSVCGIENDWAPKQELSSVFVYDMIEAFGGPEKFYSKFYITSVCPLGFTSKGKNLNYYDDKLLMQSFQPFALECFKKQLAWANNTTAFCLGEGANYKFIETFNNEHQFFERIIPLAHPRFIMQYKLKKKQEYIDKYLEAFDSV